MTYAILDRMLKLFEWHASEISRGDLTFATQAPFTGAKTIKAPNGSTVVTLDLAESILVELPPSHRHIDLFLLEPHRELGAHFHKHATAYIYGIDGNGTAHVGAEKIYLGKWGKAVFPAGGIHNVMTGDEPFLFASFQDHPIIQQDGSLDYFII